MTHSELKRAKSLKELFQGLLLFLALGIVATRSDADTIDQALQSHFADTGAVEYLHYESVLHHDSAAFKDTKYLVLDFKAALASNSLQPAVHHICQTILKDIPLVTQLSYEGYSMISVSFDSQYQYDCL